MYHANQPQSTSIPASEYSTNEQYVMILLYQSLSNLIISPEQMDLQSADQENIYLQSLACLNPLLYVCHHMQY